MNKPSLVYQLVQGVFICTCDTSNDFEDCMLPAYIKCSSCNQLWRITEPWIRRVPAIKEEPHAR